MKDLVWYAGYGSNLNKSRFLYYINGGVYPITGRVHPGCRNTALPLKSSTTTIEHELYFSRQSSAWEGKAVAFLTVGKTAGHQTICALYLVTQEQFVDIMIQENGGDPLLMPEIMPNLESAKNGKEVVVGDTSAFDWYGRLLYLGEQDGYPIYTFTTKQPDESIVANEPGINYLKVIGSGLIQDCGIDQKTAVDYLLKQCGVAGSDWTKEKLTKIITS